MRVLVGTLLGLAMVVGAAFVVHKLLGAGTLAAAGVFVIVMTWIADPKRAGRDGPA
jgi:hypothetical protein